HRHQPRSSPCDGGRRMEDPNPRSAVPVLHYNAARPDYRWRTQALRGLPGVSDRRVRLYGLWQPPDLGGKGGPTAAISLAFAAGQGTIGGPCRQPQSPWIPNARNGVPPPPARP